MSELNKQHGRYVITRLAVDMKFPIHIHIHIHRFSVDISMDIHGYIHIHRRLTCLHAAPNFAKYSSAIAFIPRKT